MLDRTDFYPVLFETGAHARITDQQGCGRDIDRLRQVDTTKDDTGIRRSRTQGEIDLDTTVQANARGANDSLQRALLKHAST